MMPANGECYPLAVSTGSTQRGGTSERHFNGINFEPHKVLENVHAAPQSHQRSLHSPTLAPGARLPRTQVPGSAGVGRVEGSGARWVGRHFGFHRSFGHGAPVCSAVAYSCSRWSSCPRIRIKKGKSSGVTVSFAKG
jgi:hypothetical protein